MEKYTFILTLSLMLLATNSYAQDVAKGTSSADLSNIILYWDSDGGLGSDPSKKYTNDKDEIEGGAAAIPIPAVLWMFGTALIGFVTLARRTNV